MTTSSAQQFLFQRIKESLPPGASLADAVAEVLHVSSDSSYRRIRGETPLILDEAKELCDHFQISLDQLLHIKNGSILFQTTKINSREYTYKQYLTDLIRSIQHTNSFHEKEVIYLSKDVPLFHNFYFQPLIAFRYFFWMKTILQDDHFNTKAIDLGGVPEEISRLSRELTKAYCLLPTSEIWNTECINSVISQIEFYKDSGLFSSAGDIRTVYNALAETMLHLKDQVENGCKYLPGEDPQTKKPNYRFFYNRVILGDNTILVTTDGVRTVYLNYNVLDYMVTKDEQFCNQSYNDMQNLMKRSTLISQTSEKQRNIFFGILLNKIQDRIKNL